MVPIPAEKVLEDERSQFPVNHLPLLVQKRQFIFVPGPKGRKEKGK